MLPRKQLPSVPQDLQKEIQKLCYIPCMYVLSIVTWNKIFFEVKGIFLFKDKGLDTQMQSTLLALKSTTVTNNYNE